MTRDEASPRYDAIIAAIAARPGVPLHVRGAIADELRAHIEDAAEDGVADPLAAFGDPEFVGQLVARAAARRDGGGVMRLVGLVCTVFLIVIAIVLGGRLQIFVNIPSVVCVIGLGCAFGVTAWGPKVFLDAYLAAARALVRPRAVTASPHAIRVIRGHILQVYGAGVIGAAIGLIQILDTVDDPSTILTSLSVLLLTPFYSLCLAEGMLRPALRALEFAGYPCEPEQGAPA